MAGIERFKVGLAQLNSVLGDNEANLLRALDFIDQAHRRGAEIIVFPELYLQGYGSNEKHFQTAEPIPGPTTERLEQAARERDMYIIMGMGRLEETYPWCIYNSLCFVGPEGLLGYYDKVHVATHHPFTEGMYFASGRRAPVFDTRLGRISVQICYDAQFPELTRAYALRGSLVNLVISAGPTEYIDDWRILLQARSLENVMYSVYCNVAGMQNEFSFFGGSKIVDPLGKVIAEAKFHEEDLLVGEVSLAATHRLRRQSLYYRDRVPELYAPLVEPLEGSGGINENRINAGSHIPMTEAEIE